MPQQIDDLPPGLTIATLQATLNDRIKVLNLILNGLMTNPADADLDMASFLIHNLADPVGDLDGVNLRTLRRMGSQTIAAPVATSRGLDALAIVSEAPGVLADGDVTPVYVVGRNRTGIPSEVWLYALVAPTTNCAINWRLQLAGVGAFQPLLTSDLVLPAGSLGPVFASNFAFKGVLTHGTVVQMVTTSGGAAGTPSMGVVVERN